MPGLPPGPRRRFLAPSLLALRRSPLEFLIELARDYGEISSIRLLNRPAILINDPVLIEEVLVTRQAKFTKGQVLRRARIILGDGLLTSEGPEHRRQRRLVQPAFHRQRLENYARVMSASALRARAQWPLGETKNMAAEMAALTLDIVARTLFTADVEAETRVIGAALTDLLGGVNRLVLPGAKWWLRLPLPGARRLVRARTVLDETIYRLIRQRRAQGVDAGDLLSTLVFSEDAERPGEHLDDTEIRDQALTLFLAGHETTANAMTWIWMLLAQNPGVRRSLDEEVTRVLAGNPPQFSDYPRLLYTQQVVREALRLYPPAWCIGRLAKEEIPLAGYSIPPGAIVLSSQWVMHRNPRFFPEPEKFLPERWTESFIQGLPKFAYFPFGGGARTCIGEGFAWMELVILLSTLTQTWSPELADPGPVQPHPQITLRPRGGVRMTVLGKP